MDPFSEMDQAPFALEAGDCISSSTTHYFNGLFLASFLVSRGDFINPCNRRPLTRNECVALDRHVKQHHAGASCVSVTDAWDMASRRINDSQEQREAASVLQHIFQYRSGRRTYTRGRAVAFAEAGLAVVDDHDIPYQDVAREQPPAADAFPELGGAGPAAVPRAWAARSAAPPGEAAFPALPAAAPPVSWGKGVRAPRRRKAAEAAESPRLLELGTGWDD